MSVENNYQDAGSGAEKLGDFTVSVSIWKVAVLSLVVGMLAAVVALILLDLIGLVTHVAYYGDFGVSLVQPSLARFGIWTALIPVAGGLLIGAMAYWGSERIRGHGIPEAMETILINGSKIEPRLAILKPISSAISIGTGGPFGAEGPIILTGGAIGSVLSQYIKLSAIERRTLLVAGACAGMAAVFGTPVAATLFGVELLVFEWKPRTVVPIGLAVVVASVFRGIFASHGLLHPAPLFPVPPHGNFSTLGVAAASLVGAICAILAWVLTNAVYSFEDLFKKIPLHWAWWPAIGGIVIGVGGLVNPNALGVGYASIGAELAGKIALTGLVSLLVVKLVIWSIALGSGTSGGILAPLLIMGAALGGIMSPLLPGGTEATWALLGMAATLSGVTRSPFTSIIFAFELTRDTGTFLPLMLACFVAHLISTIILKRSILTEKVARRGFHVSREYGVDPLEGLMVDEVMRTGIFYFSAEQQIGELREIVEGSIKARRQRIFPVVDDRGMLIGIIPHSVILSSADTTKLAGDAVIKTPVVVYGNESLRIAADRMAEKEIGASPVVEEKDGLHLLRGIITEFDILRSRQRQLIEERHREVILGRFANRVKNV